ncbi:amyloid fiber anchoring/assembly protein TapA [Halobacillus naozhouensis]|uniref:Amyloid fiber anchoring/assembly protein TapA n=1 Tax=Halobacillus naozhouensis TaxID=554880 RepID=A0ABY8IVU9_9BACI|nr:amyloid fiber anchoring/assembly protein TapA [Halobacillus naozhouensis]WFT73831.1 amyloid fiber anchoring/assembly protein TapA [Halobacillus naozhouensis]
MRKRRSRDHFQPFKRKCSLLLVTVTIISAPLSGQSLLSVPTNAAFNDIESVNFSIQADVEQDQDWDKSSLEFKDQGSEKNLLFAIVKNGDGSEVMQRTTTYEVYFAEQGNPKKGEKVAEGVIPMLDPGETFRMILEADTPGKYMFKAYHSKGHPGKGELWSEEIEYSLPKSKEKEARKEHAQEKAVKPSSLEEKEPTNKKQETDTEPAKQQKKEEEIEGNEAEPKDLPEKEQKQNAESPQSPEPNPEVKKEKSEPQPKAAQAADSKEKMKKENTQENQQDQQKKSEQPTPKE